MNEEVKVIQQIDVRGEICPYPLTKTKKKVMELNTGEQLEVLLDYPLSLETIPRWAESQGYQVLEVKQTGNAEWRIRLEK